MVEVAVVVVVVPLNGLMGLIVGMRVTGLIVVGLVVGLLVDVFLVVVFVLLGAFSP